MELRKDDFYYGSFISTLLDNNSANIFPVLLGKEEDFKRRTYDICTEKGDFTLYIKYLEKPLSITGKNSQTFIWNFLFTHREIEEIKTLIDEGEKEKIKFVFICSVPKLCKSKFASISCDDLIKCFNITEKLEEGQSRNVKVTYSKKDKMFNVYGSDSFKDNRMFDIIKVEPNNLEYEI